MASGSGKYASINKARKAGLAPTKAKKRNPSRTQAESQLSFGTPF